MVRGIAVIGLNGGGKSTITHALAKAIHYFEMDVEDYYFPEQKSSRRNVLEHNMIDEQEFGCKMPFSNQRSKNEVQTAILEDIEVHPKFIIAGVTMNWEDILLSRIDLAFCVQTPLKERIHRIQEREERRFGTRILPNGDMYQQHMDFLHAVAKRDSKRVEENVAELNCPVILIDGTLSVEENVQLIIDELRREI